MTTIQLYLAIIILTMLQRFVTALPIPSMTRDNVTKPSKNDIEVLKYLVQYGYMPKKLDTRNLSQKLKLTAGNTAETPYTNDEISNEIKKLQNSFGLKLTPENTAEITPYTNDEISNGIKQLQNSFGLKLTPENTAEITPYTNDEISNGIKKLQNSFGLKLTPENTAEITPYTNDEISNEIKKLQHSFGLKVTGELNEETLKLIPTSRRGASGPTEPFQLKLHHRNRRYTIYHRTKTGGYKIHKWGKTDIVWQIYKPWKGNLTKSKQEEIFDKAFKVWEYASSLRFVKKTPGGPWSDIDIEFHSGAHGDDNNFDGPGTRLAHAFLPGTLTRDGNIHMDADENWTENFLYNVAVHEIGHSLGLGHSGYSDSVMFSSYTRTSPITSLHKDDIEGVKKIYGECQTKVDAVIYLANGDLYFIRKDLVWKYDSTADRVYNGYPKKINDEFPSVSGTKIPSDLDCASRYLNEKKSIDLFFVKGDQVYVYDVVRKKITVKTTAQFWPSHGKVPGIPKKVPVAVSITKFPVGTLIFKDDYVWRYNDDSSKREIRSGYPVNITASEWNGLPKDVDDGYFDQSNFFYYFFKGTQYYVSSLAWPPKTKPYVLLQGDIHKKWKGICSAKY